MKKLTVLILIILLSGCANLTYQVTDGAKTTKVTYNRLFTTADNIKGQVGDNVKVEASGQKIDATTLNALLQILSAVPK